MKLAWMGEYREVVEQLIRYCNIYASVYKKEGYRGAETPISYAQIQVVEYLLENEDLHQNMSQIASRLGITPSSFTKLVNKLTDKGLLEKFHVQGNRKNVIVRVSALGRETYEGYSEYIYREHFSKMFDVGRALPREHLPLIARMLGAGLGASACEGAAAERVLIPIGKDGKKESGHE